jgi:hypothetical protein
MPNSQTTQPPLLAVPQYLLNILTIHCAGVMRGVLKHHIQQSLIYLFIYIKPWPLNQLSCPNLSMVCLIMLSAAQTT